MATPSLDAQDYKIAAEDSRLGSRYVARQPIMDSRARVHGYELLFRSGPETAFRGDSDLATRTMLDNAVIYGLDKLTSGMPAFINCTGESLTENLVHILPPSMTVLEILESIEPTPRLIHACRNLKASGFRLALDDFVWKPKFEPLVEIADYIKVDFALTSAESRKALLNKLHGVTVALVAEKVETLADHRIACAEGFNFFQGYYFCRPVLIRNSKVPVNRMSHIEILRLMRTEDIDLREATRLVKLDASLTYRLLRLVNSPMCAVRQEVRSIQAALLAVGEETFRRIATLAITSELGAGQPVEILRMAFLRGRFCETAAADCGLDPTEQYLLGMLSLLPAMLQMAMEDLTSYLPLRDNIRDSLNGAANLERCLLAWLECHEHADWEACDALVQAHQLNQERLLSLYAEALVWAEEALRSAD
jgi:EAL and modified HD-GYP domain-containing signal transduction protein